MRLVLDTIHDSRLEKEPSQTSPDFIYSEIKQHDWFQGLTIKKPTGHVMHQQFNIQQLYALPTLYLCVLYLSENKQRLVPLTA